MRQRQPKTNDQEQIQKGFDLLKHCICSNPEIEPTLWASAFWSILVEGYATSGMRYEQFTKEWDRIKHHYKPWFKV